MCRQGRNRRHGEVREGENYLSMVKGEKGARVQ